MPLERKTISLNSDIVKQVEKLSVIDNRTFSNTIETILKKHFKENKYKHLKL